MCHDSMSHQILDLAEDLNEQLVGQINAPFVILRDEAIYLVTRVRKNYTGFTVVHGN